jgi:hypothetical protein
LFGQTITIGIVGGVPVTETFDSGGLHAADVTAKTIRYTVGPAFDFRLFGPLRVEVDALYQPFSFRTYCQDCESAPTYGHTFGNLWQFSTLLKIQIPTPVLKAFVEGGPSVQLASDTTESSYNLIEPTELSTQHPSPNAVPGLSTGGGLSFRLGPLILAPEVRYTHWLDENFNPFNTPQRGSHLNQVEVLLSIRI